MILLFLLTSVAAVCEIRPRSCTTINRHPCEEYTLQVQEEETSCGHCFQNYDVLGVEGAGRFFGTLSCSLRTAEDSRARTGLSFSERTGLELDSTLLFTLFAVLAVPAAIGIGKCTNYIGVAMSAVFSDKKAPLVTAEFLD